MKKISPYQAFNSAVVEHQTVDRLLTNYSTIFMNICLLIIQEEAIVVHKVDNAAVLHGKITGKQMIGKPYTIDCGAMILQVI